MIDFLVAADNRVFMPGILLMHSSLLLTTESHVNHKDHYGMIRSRWDHTVWIRLQSTWFNIRSSTAKDIQQGQSMRSCIGGKTTDRRYTDQSSLDYDLICMVFLNESGHTIACLWFSQHVFANWHMSLFWKWSARQTITQVHMQFNKMSYKCHLIVKL